jgi:hypothetical protein
MRNQFGRVIPMGAMGLTIQGFGGRGRHRTLSDAVLETAALPVSYTPDIWHRLPVTIQRLCGHNAALCH